MNFQEIEALLDANNKKTSGYLSVAELRSLATQASVYSPNPKGAVTLLYSGTFNGTIRTAEVAESIGTHSGGRVRTIGQTDAGRVLAGDPFLDAMVKALGGDEATAKQAAADLIYGPRDATGTRAPLGYFDEVSARFIQESGGGRFQTLTPFAKIDGVFGSTELSRVLADPKTESINGISRQVLVDFQAELVTKGASSSTAFAETFNLINKFGVTSCLLPPLLIKLTTWPALYAWSLKTPSTTSRQEAIGVSRYSRMMWIGRCCWILPHRALSGSTRARWPGA